MEKSEIEPLLVSNLQYIKNLAMKYTKNVSEAEDLTSDVIIKVLEKSEMFQTKENKNKDFQKWVTTILRNCFINNYRVEQRHNEVWIDCDPHQLGDKCLLFNSEESDSNIQLEQLNKIIIDSNNKTLKHSKRKRAFSEIDYKIFQAYINGYKYQEIADLFEINIGSVKSKIFLFKERAKQLILENDIR